MDFGGTFDDSLFAETRSRDSTPLKSYNAKICVPEWFVLADSTDDVEEINLEKYKADYCYSRRDHEAAVRHFRRCLDLLPQSNMSMRRDIYESIVRCHMHLDSLDEAVKMAESFYRDTQNFEQKTNTLRLLVEVYHARNDATAEALAIERSIILHPMHVDLWLSLAKAYSRIDDSETLPALDGVGDNCTWPLFSEYDKHHYTSTCCVRVLGLLDYCERIGQTFALEKLRKQKENITEILEELSVPQEFIDSCSKVICADVRSAQEAVDPTDGLQMKPEQIVSCSDNDLHKHFVGSWMSWKTKT